MVVAVVMVVTVAMGGDNTNELIQTERMIRFIWSVNTWFFVQYPSQFSYCRFRYHQ